MGASTIYPTFLPVYLPLYLLCVVCFNEGYALGRRAVADTSHTIHVSSLLPSSVCNPSAKALDKKSLPVVHKHGPCSQLHQANVPTRAEILLRDEARVKSIHSKLANNTGSTDVKVTDATTLPAKSGLVIGSANYIVTVGLGTPKKDLSFTFDTGSDLTWTQCQPCVKSCYKQQDPIFAPSQSSTYSNISCNSTVCNSLASATGIKPGCSSSSACVYGIVYGDQSFSIGFFAKETLTLTSKDVFPNFFFGCGQDNEGLFSGSAGLLGLGRDKLSLPSQTASKYNKVFSYCLPSSPSSTGFLSFGDGGLAKSVKFTAISKKSQGTSFYEADIIAITVGGKKLPISASVFATAATVIDSGTTITRLPATAYAALKSAFRQDMSKYPMAKALSNLDTCYNFSNYTTVSVPKISFFFSGDVEVPIDVRGIFFVVDASQVCLAFAGNRDDRSVGIFGNTQQITLQVVYDGAGGRIGFGTGGCA
ncbi:hypothetical protein PTKIN_Ptkin19aG0130600 [Pterospermum kingtungense]